MKTTKYKGYTVHSNGKVEKKKGQGYLDPALDVDGYKYFNAVDNGRRMPYRLHRFIWEAFNGQIPTDMTIDHIDGDKVNNRLNNLQLLTRGENTSKSNQRLSKKQIDDIRYLRANTNYSTTKIAEEVGSSQSSVMRVLSNKRFAYVY